MDRDAELRAIATYLAKRGATRLPSSREVMETDPMRGTRWVRSNNGKLVFRGEGESTRSALRGRGQRKPPRKVI